MARLLNANDKARNAPFALLCLSDQSRVFYLGGVYQKKKFIAFFLVALCLFSFSLTSFAITDALVAIGEHFTSAINFLANHTAESVIRVLSLVSRGTTLVINNQTVFATYSSLQDSFWSPWGDHYEGYIYYMPYPDTYFLAVENYTQGVSSSRPVYASMYKFIVITVNEDLIGCLCYRDLTRSPDRIIYNYSYQNLDLLYDAVLLGNDISLSNGQGIITLLSNDKDQTAKLNSILGVLNGDFQNYIVSGYTSSEDKYTLYQQLEQLKQGLFGGVDFLDTSMDEILIEIRNEIVYLEGLIEEDEGVIAILKEQKEELEDQTSILRRIENILKKGDFDLPSSSLWLGLIEALGSVLTVVISFLGTVFSSVLKIVGYFTAPLMGVLPSGALTLLYLAFPLSFILGFVHFVKELL